MGIITSLSTPSATQTGDGATKHTQTEMITIAVNFEINSVKSQSKRNKYV